MRILAVISGEYGRRHVENIRAHAPDGWTLADWTAPRVLPPVLDDPDDFLPPALPAADLLLSFAEHPGVAELLPGLVRLAGARAVIAAIDNEAWLPRGLARQLRGWLAEIGVPCVTPKPLCSLTDTEYRAGRGAPIPYSDPLIAAFARRFGRPCLRIAANVGAGVIEEVEVVRDAVCGSARYVAAGLAGVPLADAEFQAGMLHHHYPCLASMGIDADYDDTLMHVSGNIIRDEVAAEVRRFRPVDYVVPGIRSD